jgi:hypothetical protein
LALTHKGFGIKPRFLAQGDEKMAVAKTHGKKSPSQNPVDFYKLKQHGGAEGKGAQKVGDKLTGGPMREKIFGRKSLS